LKNAIFIKSFNVDVPDMRLSLLNTEKSFEKLITLKFLDMITKSPNYSFKNDLQQFPELITAYLCILQRVMQDYSGMRHSFIRRIPSDPKCIVFEPASFRGLETIIDKDSKVIAKTWIDIWYNGLINLREHYIEILINTQQDNEVLAMLLRVYKENKKSPIKNEEQLKNFIIFNKSVNFEEEFARKITVFFLSYILSPKKIADKTITSRKIENISLKLRAYLLRL